jgi:hypothetical protein
MQSLLEILCRVTAHSGRQLPAPYNDHFGARQFDTAKVLEKISHPRFSREGTDLFGFTASIRAEEGGKAGVNGSGYHPVWIGDLRVNAFGNRHGMNLPDCAKTGKEQLIGHVDGDCGNDPQVVVKTGCGKKWDGILHEDGKAQLFPYPVQLILARVNYGKRCGRKASTEPLRRHIPEATRAENPELPWRKRLGEGGVS